jgi:hypothetical protein
MVRPMVPLAYFFCFSHNSPHVRMVAVVALGGAEPSHTSTLPVLRRLLEHQPHFFWFAADTLLVLGPNAASIAPLLVPLLRNPDDKVYRAADRVLRKIDPPLAARGWSAIGTMDGVPTDLNPLWDDLAAPDAWRADLAAWRLSGTGPKAVTLLRERLQPPKVLTVERISALIADLDDDEFDVRQRSSAQLGGAGEAISALRRALAGTPSLEAHRRMEDLLISLETKQSLEDRRRLCALRILESVGSPEARDLLRTLARGDPRLAITQEAAAALVRLEKP